MSRARFPQSFILWILLFGGFAGAVFAQASDAILKGTITDQTGAVIPNAKVTVRNVNTGFERATMTNEVGYYYLSLLPVGEYELIAEAPGFATLKRSGIRLMVGQTLTLDLTLQAAALAEVVTVTAEPPMVEVTRTHVAASVNDRAVANLPAQGRNFLDFILLTPGVTRDHRAGDLSFGGLRGPLNSLQIDGVDNNNTFFGQTLGRTGSGRAPYQFSIDAVKEFQVNTNSYSAEFGRAGGAVINVVTKSGTNEFHGTAFWYYRDKALNANDFFSNARRLPKPPFHINQFGGNVGGPIVRDKAFFFFLYDGQRQKLPNVVIPGGPGFVPPSDPDSQRAFQSLLALAQSYNRTFDQDVFMGKGDWQISPAHRLSGRYNAQRFTGGNLENPGQTSALEHTGDSLVWTDTLTLSLSSTLTTRWLNEFRFQFARDKQPGKANSDKPEAEIRERGRVVLTIGRNFFSPRETTIRRYQLVNNLSALIGRHGLKFGVDINIDRIKNFFPGQFGGQYFFDSLAQFATGRPSRYVQAFAGEGTTGPLTFPHNSEFAGFFQDDWRVTPRLTLNLGLRYDLQNIADPPTRNPDPGLAALGLRTDRINLDKNNFAPRFGFAWSPLASHRLVIRGGYGIFYARTPSIMAAQAHSQNAINVRVLTFTGDLVPTYPQRFDRPPTGGVPSPPSIFVFAPDYVNPYVQQGSLGVEYELAPNLSISANYLAVKGTHLQRTRNINLLPPVLAQIEIVGEGIRTYRRFPGRLLPQFVRISLFESTANSIYHGAAFQVHKRFSHNVQFLLSYTISKAIDDTPDATSVVAFSSGDDAKQVQDPFNLRDDRGISYTDIPQRLVLSWIWDLAYARNLQNRVARAILGGWSVSGILTAQSAPAYSALVGTDLNNDTNARTDRVPGFGRNTFRGFNFVSLDPRLTREIALGEKAKLHFIFEGFNILNRTNFRTITLGGALPSVNAIMYTLATSGPNAGKLVRRTDFGTPTETFDPRILQLAVKIVF
ncbi:MAG: TonB-dependent receptor [Blastocatellia bacterium]|nr:TonB-dependent receptor [Blastocatellia bacterium]MDW8256542.1 TonB-dependent receptor [Acidobacteriota bacterium]